MKNSKININCDLGENMGYDADLMPYLHSCNIACGGHAGNEDSMRATVQLAMKSNVEVGAHPAFPDKEDFGLKPMDISEEALIDSLTEQLWNFARICRDEDAVMHHIKLHGALYDMAAKDAQVAKIVYKAIKKTHLKAIIYTPAGSELAKLMQGEYEVFDEVFIDRKYKVDRSFMDPSISEGVITDPIEAWSQVKNIYLYGQVATVDGQKIGIQADTFCIHGNNPGALDILKHILVEIQKL